jgi:D-alanyl-D-alanine carboxypeptidase/D-alanyl-D-alanine carboxypeptidase (penicillin-binding protein 5/6)
MTGAMPGTGPESIFDTSDLPNYDAKSYILINRKTGQTICSKNPEEKMYPASTTKIMTGILALELGNLDMEMTASSKAIRDIGADGSNIGIIAGEVMRLDNLMDALIVKSANEAANIIAENISGTQEDFIALMNEKAAELGALNTNFVNTHGNHDASHYTTAYDLALITNYAMNNGQFREFAAKRSIILSPTNKHGSWDPLKTTNALLLDESEKSYAVTGVKTGYTSDAGYCLVATGVDASGSGMELLCVVLGVWGESASARRFSIASSLLEYGFENFKTTAFVSENDLVETISVLGAESTDSVDAVADGTVSLFLPMDAEKWNVSKIEYVKPEIAAPVAKGEILGYVEIRNNGAFAGRVNVIASKDVAGAKGGARQASKRSDTGSARSGTAHEAGDIYVGGDEPGGGGAGAMGALGAVAAAAGANGDGTGNGGANGGGDGASGSGNGSAGEGGDAAGGGSGEGAAGTDGGEGGGSGETVASANRAEGGGDAASGAGRSGGAAGAGGAAGNSGAAGAGSARTGAGSDSQPDGKPLASSILMIAFLAVVSLAALISAMRTINKIRAGRRAQFSNSSMGRRQIPMRPYGGQPGGGRSRGASRRRAALRHAGDGRAAAPARIGRPFGGQYGAKDSTGRQ